MSVIKYVEIATWADLFNAADFNALTSGSGVYSTAGASGVFDNTSDLAPLAEVSFIMVTSTITPVAGARLALYFVPVLHDGTSLADGDAGGTTANQPPGAYLAAVLPFTSKSAVAHLAGTREPIRLPAYKFKPYMLNLTGANLPSSSVNMTCKFRKIALQVV